MDQLLQCTHLKNGKTCKFKGRSDNYRRHVNEVHLKKLRACEYCGKKMTQTALSRHKKATCSLKNDQTSETNIASNEIIGRNLSQPPSTSTISTDIVEEKEYSIEAKIKLLTLNDGTKTLVPLNIDLIIDDFIVTFTASCSGKLEKNVECITADVICETDHGNSVLKNDILLTPVDSPIEDGKLI